MVTNLIIWCMGRLC